jgi:hypothetical protein
VGKGVYYRFSESILLLFARAGLTKLYLFFINNRVIGLSSIL